ncbi:MAG: hypothetical protein K8T10_00580 [Candidatus Eremiobacteraeota bacterium]|nr:hypothetical protein [Candidatus Eremiobacteraeota bacterium]
MDKINPANGKSEITEISGAPLKIKYTAPEKPRKKPTKAKEDNFPVDHADISFRYDHSVTKKKESEFTGILSSYQKKEMGFSRLKSTMRGYFNIGGEKSRQNMAEHLFSKDGEIRAFAAELFSGMDHTKDHISPFDEAAREKALFSARDSLKKEPESKTQSASCLKVIGKMGQSDDIPLLISAKEKINTGKWKDSPYLNSTLMDSLNKVVSRNPDSIDGNSGKEIASITMQGMNSKNRTVRRKTVSLALGMSDNASFTNNFSRKMLEMPRNPETAHSMSMFASNLNSKNPERVIFTSMVLDRAMKGSDMEFKENLLKGATKYFVEYPPDNASDNIRDTTSVLGKHFETILQGKEREEFNSLEPKGKMGKMIQHFHG